jgi:hypothetical protein
MEDKLTALQWFYNQALAGTIDTKKNVMYLTLPRDVFKKAKQMEKEQIKEAYLAGESDGDHLEDSAGIYYKETYGGI